MISANWAISCTSKIPFLANPLEIPAALVTAIPRAAKVLEDLLELGRLINEQGDEILAEIREGRAAVKELREAGDKLLASGEKMLAAANELTGLAGPIHESAIEAREELHRSRLELEKANEQVSRILELAGPLERLNERLPFGRRDD